MQSLLPSRHFPSRTLSGLTVPSRLDYGGRLSYTTVAIPTLAITAMALLLWISHSCGTTSWFGLLWFLLGTSLIISDFAVSGLAESRTQNTASYRINAMGSWIWLLIFEIAFFSGTYWLCVLPRVQGYSEVSYSLTQSDLALQTSPESSLESLTGLSFDSSAILVSSSGTGIDISSAIMPVILLNLYLLLIVTLLLNLIHRWHIMNE